MTTCNETTETVHMARPVHYLLPDDLQFETLAEPKRTGEAIRLRFSRGRGTTLDVPLSPKALAGLVQEIGLLHGADAHEIVAELADLHSKGLRILREP